MQIVIAGENIPGIRLEPAGADSPGTPCASLGSWLAFGAHQPRLRSRVYPLLLGQSLHGGISPGYPCVY